MATLVGLVVWVRWFLVLSVASDEHVSSPKIIARVTTDLHGAIATFVSGEVAYFSVASISTANAKDSQAVQLVFCIAILAHVAALMYYFVVVPANEPTGWVMTANNHQTSEGSIGSVGQHTLSSRGTHRPIALPPGFGSRRPSDQVSELALARRGLAMAVKFSINELLLFAAKLRETAPQGVISYAQFLSTWEICFPDKLENGKE